MPHLPSAVVSSLPGRAARRSRPPERLSPYCTPRARRRRGSPSRDPPASAPESALGSGVRAGRNPSRRPSPAVLSPAADPSAPLRRVRGAAACLASPSDVPRGGAARPAAENPDVGTGSAGQRRSRRARTSPCASPEPGVSRRNLPVTAAPCSVGGERLPQPHAASTARMTSQGAGSRRPRRLRSACNAARSQSPPAVGVPSPEVDLHTRPLPYEPLLVSQGRGEDGSPSPSCFSVDSLEDEGPVGYVPPLCGPGCGWPLSWACQAQCAFCRT